MRFKYWCYILVIPILFNGCRKNRINQPYYFEVTIDGQTYKGGEDEFYATYIGYKFSDMNYCNLNVLGSGSSILYLTTENFYHMNFFFDTDNPTKLTEAGEGLLLYDPDTENYDCDLGILRTAKVPLRITRNDNVDGGIIEGNFSGLIGQYISTSQSCCIFHTISGRFKLKIQKN